jgi:hypothetical protein
VTKSGYAFMMFLPDTASPAVFVHEKSGPGLMGGAGKIGVDLSETNWCAYAQPVARNNSGNRRFFINQAGDVMQSANEIAKAQGVTTPITGNSAFKAGTAGGITAQTAVGTAGFDGDVWKVTN